MLPTTKESPKKVFKNAKIISEDATSFTVEFDTFGTTEELFTKEDGSVGSFVVPNEQLPEIMNGSFDISRKEWFLAKVVNFKD